MKTVDCVVVTYNRLQLLKECIQAIKEQTYPINNFFIIDNCSTDRTWDYLQTIKETSGTNIKKIVPIRLEKNLGGAGGFNMGLKVFMNKSNADYVWIMDDDTVPRSNALEILLKKTNITSELGFLCSNVRWQDKSVAVMNIPAPSKKWNEFSEFGVTKVDSASFVSIIFPRNVVSKVGYPISEFFIWGDDMEYTLRITQDYNFEGFMVNESLVEHKIKQNIATDLVKEKNINRIKRYYLAQRNTIFYLKKHADNKEVIKATLRQGIKIPVQALLKSKNYKFYRAWISIKGTVAGMFFNPKIERVTKK
ncbi:glycosyltransferase family 2 protein [Lactobacillus gasseri]|uniref:glycosyltransferase family 2 protein n=1 Tax=Lactobacillus gasseri TaxID=1596 RepID=UPI0022E870AB|nr:glycosyltransferase family 2 protein [Lactobacillus gasseri]